MCHLLIYQCPYFPQTQAKFGRSYHSLHKVWVAEERTHWWWSDCSNCRRISDHIVCNDAEKHMTTLGEDSHLHTKKRTTCSGMMKTALHNVLLPKLFNVVNNIVQHCYIWFQASSDSTTCSILLTTLNNVGRTTLFDHVFIRPEQVVRVTRSKHGCEDIPSCTQSKTSNFQKVCWYLATTYYQKADIRMRSHNLLQVDRPNLLSTGLMLLVATSCNCNKPDFNKLAATWSRWQICRNFFTSWNKLKNGHHTTSPRRF